MKLSVSAVAIFAFAALMRDGVNGHELRGVMNERKLGDDDCVIQLFSQLNAGLCMAGSGEGFKSHVYLGSNCLTFCSPDENGLIRVKDSDLCLQASHGNVVKDGSMMRLYECDEKKVSQRFSWTDEGDSSPLKLTSNEYNGLCATSRGTHAEKGDPIIFKVCSDLRPVERQKWFGD